MPNRYGSSLKFPTPHVEANIPRGLVKIDDHEQRRAEIEELTGTLKAAKAAKADAMRAERDASVASAMTRPSPPYDEGVAMPAPSPLDQKEPGKVNQP